MRDIFDREFDRTAQGRLDPTYLMKSGPAVPFHPEPPEDEESKKKFDEDSKNLKENRDFTEKVEQHLADIKDVLKPLIEKDQAHVQKVIDRKEQSVNARPARATSNIGDQPTFSDLSSGAVDYSAILGGMGTNIGRFTAAALHKGSLYTHDIYMFQQQVITNRLLLALLNQANESKAPVKIDNIPTVDPIINSWSLIASDSKDMAAKLGKMAMDYQVNTGGPHAPINLPSVPKPGMAPIIPESPVLAVPIMPPTAPSTPNPSATPDHSGEGGGGRGGRGRKRGHAGGHDDDDNWTEGPRRSHINDLALLHGGEHGFVGPLDQLMWQFQHFRGRAMAHMIKTLSGGLIGVSAFTPMAENIAETVKYQQQIRQMAFQNEGITKELYRQQNAYMARNELMEIAILSGQKLSDTQKAYVKNLQAGYKSQKDTLKVTRTALGVATMISTGAEETASLFHEMYMTLSLSAIQMDEIARGVKRTALNSKITGENLLKAVQGAKPLMDAMKRSGTLTASKASGAVAVTAEMQKLGISDEMAPIMKAMTNMSNWVNADDKSRNMVGILTGGDMSVVQSGAIFNDKKAQARVADQADGFLRTFGFDTKTWQQASIVQKNQANWALEQLGGISLTGLIQQVETFRKMSKPLSEQLQEIDKQIVTTSKYDSYQRNALISQKESLRQDARLRISTNLGELMAKHPQKSVVDTLSSARGEDYAPMMDDLRELMSGDKFRFKKAGIDEGNLVTPEGMQKALALTYSDAIDQMNSLLKSKGTSADQQFIITDVEKTLQEAMGDTTGAKMTVLLDKMNKGQQAATIAEQAQTDPVVAALKKLNDVNVEISTGIGKSVTLLTGILGEVGILSLAFGAMSADAVVAFGGMFRHGKGGRAAARTAGVAESVLGGKDAAKEITGRDKRTYDRIYENHINDLTSSGVSLADAQTRAHAKATATVDTLSRPNNMNPTDYLKGEEYRKSYQQHAEDLTSLSYRDTWKRHRKSALEEGFTGHQARLEARARTARTFHAEAASAARQTSNKIKSHAFLGNNPFGVEWGEGVLAHRLSRMPHNFRRNRYRMMKGLKRGVTNLGVEAGAVIGTVMPKGAAPYRAAAGALRGTGQGLASFGRGMGRMVMDAPMLPLKMGRALIDNKLTRAAGRMVPGPIARPFQSVFGTENWLTDFFGKKLPKFVRSAFDPKAMRDRVMLGWDVIAGNKGPLKHLRDSILKSFSIEDAANMGGAARLVRGAGGYFRDKKTFGGKAITAAKAGKDWMSSNVTSIATSIAQTAVGQKLASKVGGVKGAMSGMGHSVGRFVGGDMRLSEAVLRMATAQEKIPVWGRFAKMFGATSGIPASTIGLMGMSGTMGEAAVPAIGTMGAVAAKAVLPIAVFTTAMLSMKQGLDASTNSMKLFGIEDDNVAAAAKQLNIAEKDVTDAHLSAALAARQRAAESAGFLTGIVNTLTLGLFDGWLGATGSITSSLAIFLLDWKYLNAAIQAIMIPIKVVYGVLTGLWEFIKEVFGGIWEGIKIAIEPLGEAFSYLEQEMGGVWTELTVAFQPVADALKPFLGEMSDSASIIGTITWALKGVGHGVGLLFKALGYGAAFLIKTVVPAIKMVIDVFAAVASTVVKLFAPIIDGVATVFTGIVDFVTGIVGFFKGLFSGDTDTLLIGFGKIVSGIKGILGGLAEIILQSFVGLVTSIPALIFNVAGALLKGYSKWMKNIGKLFGGMWGETFMGLLFKPLEVLGSMLSGIGRLITSLWSVFSKIAKGDFGSAWNIIKNTVKDTFLDALRSMGDKISEVASWVGKTFGDIFLEALFLAMGPLGAAARAAKNWMEAPAAAANGNAAPAAPAAPAAGNGNPGLNAANAAAAAGMLFNPLGAVIQLGKHLLGFADGGVVTSPGLAMVGEAGPEVIIPMDQLSQVAAQGKQGLPLSTSATSPDAAKFVPRFGMEITNAQAVEWAMNRGSEHLCSLLEKEHSHIHVRGEGDPRYTINPSQMTPVDYMRHLRDPMFRHPMGMGEGKDYVYRKVNEGRDDQYRSLENPGSTITRTVNGVTQTFQGPVNPAEFWKDRMAEVPAGTLAPINNGARIAQNPAGVDFATPMTPEQMAKAVQAGNQDITKVLEQGMKIAQRDSNAEAAATRKGVKNMYLDPMTPSRSSLVAYQAANTRGENVRVETPEETKKRVEAATRPIIKDETPEERQRRMERVRQGTVSTGGGVRPAIPMYQLPDEWKRLDLKGKSIFDFYPRQGGEKWEDYEKRINGMIFEKRMHDLRMTGTINTATITKPDPITGKSRRPEPMPPPIGTYVNSLSPRDLMKHRGDVEVIDNEKLPKPYAPGWGEKMVRGSLVVAYDPQMFPIIPETVTPPVPMRPESVTPLVPPVAVPHLLDPRSGEKPFVGPMPPGVLAPSAISVFEKSIQTARTPVVPTQSMTSPDVGDFLKTPPGGHIVPYSYLNQGPGKPFMKVPDWAQARENKEMLGKTFLDSAHEGFLDLPQPPIVQVPGLNLKPLTPQEQKDLMPNNLPVIAPQPSSITGPKAIEAFEKSIQGARVTEFLNLQTPPTAPASDMKPLTPQEQKDLMPNNLTAIAGGQITDNLPATPKMTPPAASSFDGTMPPIVPMDDNLTPNRFNEWIDRSKVTHEDAMAFIRTRESVTSQRAREEALATTIPIPSKNERLGSIQASIAAEHLRWPTVPPTPTHADHMRSIRERHGVEPLKVPATPTAPGYGIDVPIVRPDASRLMDDVGHRMTRLAVTGARMVGQKASTVQDSRTVGLTPSASFSTLFDEEGRLRTADARARIEPLPLQDIHERIHQEVATSQPEVAKVVSPAMEATADNTEKAAGTLTEVADLLRQVLAALTPTGNLSGYSDARGASTRSNINPQRSPQYHQLSFGQFGDSAVKGVVNDGVS